MNNDSIVRRPVARWAGMAALLAAGVVGGGVLAGTLSASAASSSPSTGASTSSSAATSGGATARGHGGAQPIRSDEKAASTATVATLRAAALKAVPGGSVYRIETDAGDGAYEAHMTKADGSLVTVKFDKNLAVTKVEAGMGTGDPGPSEQAQPGANG